MILARCPHCQTTFRAEPEALKQRAGKVRCGKCRRVFNALDHLLVDAPVLVAPVAAAPAFALTPPPAAEPTANEAPHDAADAPADEAGSGATEPLAVGEQPGAPGEITALGDNSDAGHGEAAPAAATADDTPLGADPILDTGDGGLVAARDSRDIPGYSKWAEDALSAPGASFAEAHHTGWLAVFSAVVLGLMLLIQAVHYWRMEIAQRWPDSRPWLEEACRSANCAVPYPRDASQISLEASELQIDPERGNMLVLNLTLKNRAEYAQEFPALELTLTDSRDQVVVRRILAPAEWLPELDRNASKAGPGEASTPPAFPAGKEIAARLWIDAKDTGAVGYRLFVFYP